MDGTVVFARWRQCAPHLIHAPLSSPESTTQTASRSVQPFLHSSLQNVPILYNGPLFPLKIDPYRGEIWTLYLTFIGAIWARHLDWFSRFLQSSPLSVPILYDGPPISTLKILLSHGKSGDWTASNTWFLGLIRVLSRNCISMGLAVFAELTTVTDWQTTLLGL